MNAQAIDLMKHHLFFKNFFTSNEHLECAEIKYEENTVDTPNKDDSERMTKKNLSIILLTPRQKS